MCLIGNNCDVIKFFDKYEFGSENWIVMGSIIHYLSYGSEKGYNLWHDYSVMDKENYDIDFCDMMWETYKKIYKKKNNFSSSSSSSSSDSDSIIPPIIPNGW